MRSNKNIYKRAYFQNYERYRELDNADDLVLERFTHHINDGEKKVATLDQETGSSSIYRFQYGNNLGSVGLELDDSAGIISYEEYYPFGGTAYYAHNSAIDVPKKRYKYCGKEQDEEPSKASSRTPLKKQIKGEQTGLYYYGARYYAPWLCRFSSVDPKALEYVHQSSYVFADNNPIVKYDVNGEGTNGDGCAAENQPQATNQPLQNTSTSAIEPIETNDKENKSGFIKRTILTKDGVQQPEGTPKKVGYVTYTAGEEVQSVGDNGKNRVETSYVNYGKTSSPNVRTEITYEVAETRNKPLEKITPIGIKPIPVDKPELTLNLTPTASPENKEIKDLGRPKLPPQFKEGLGFEAPVNTLDNKNTVPGRLSEEMTKYLDKAGLQLSKLSNLESITINISINIGQNTTVKEYEFMRHTTVSNAFENMKIILQNRLGKNFPIFLNAEVGKSDTSMGKGTYFDYKLKK